jgi:hypothetical protein
LGVNGGTAGLVTGSFVSFVIGRLAVAAKEIGDRLGDMAQIQMVVASSTRQIDVLEEYMYKLLEMADRGYGTREGWQALLDAEVAKISEILGQSLHLIQIYAEPAGSAGTQLEQVLAMKLGRRASGETPSQDPNAKVPAGGPAA